MLKAFLVAMMAGMGVVDCQRGSFRQRPLRRQALLQIIDTIKFSFSAIGAARRGILLESIFVGRL